MPTPIQTKSLSCYSAVPIVYNRSSCTAHRSDRNSIDCDRFICRSVDASSTCQLQSGFTQLSGMFSALFSNPYPAFDGFSSSDTRINPENAL
ncbi:hypothetical protein B9Z55_020181 [Caenorhabditis nigoni]|uniref:Uncharacterized protein n=1 Tax=Caenorhabditis nigoni TaxID=1611254 RepID=A0A2G5TLN1_9PELO|nr:hypothetical protein B9Z55_020181 [Caenorhabditis nigoni]